MSYELLSPLSHEWSKYSRKGVLWGWIELFLVAVKRNISPWWIGKVLCGIFLIANCFNLDIRRNLIPGQTVALLGGLIHLYHYLLLKRANKGLDPPQNLVTKGGLFPWLRHPMYLGDLLILSGLLWLHPNNMGVGGLFVAIVMLAGQRKREELLLKDSFPEEFPKYQKTSWF